MKHVWYEVWGVEENERPPPILLMKIPGEGFGSEKDLEKLRRNLEAMKVTQLEIRKIEE